jgi:para-nitrobenzyl esterase
MNGENLSRHGVVVVTFNYRLGLFGFFSHPASTSASR